MATITKKKPAVPHDEPHAAPVAAPVAATPAPAPAPVAPAVPAGLTKVTHGCGYVTHVSDEDVAYAKHSHSFLCPRCGGPVGAWTFQRDDGTPLA